MTREILFRTIHGSRLYGLAHERSDYDWYTVVTKQPVTNPFTSPTTYSTQEVIGGQDSVVKDLGTWLMECSAGVPQALEAMFSPSPEVDRLSALRSAYRAPTSVWNTYLRTTKNFCSGDFKRRRHGVRLALNLRALSETNRFNPMLTEEEVGLANSMAEINEGDRLFDILKTLALG